MTSKPTGNAPKTESAIGVAMSDLLCPVAVLFARVDSIYKQLPSCDVWDIQRNALKYKGKSPVVAHPPCRAWSQLRHQAKPVAGEKELALFAVKVVRENGGVLEHPARSVLWTTVGLPEPGERDKWGGWTMTVPQWWWGHDCDKSTRLYIVGCQPKDIPTVPLKLGEAPCVQTYSHQCRRRPQMKHTKREATPRDFAIWLVSLARQCKGHNGTR